MTIEKSVIVLFGLGHVGKSTLLGFLATRNEVVRRNGKRAGVYQGRPRNGLRFKPEIRLLCRYRSHGKATQNRTYGTDATYAHDNGAYRQYAMRCRVDDYRHPGAEHGERERIKGMFYGDIGVFMIEAGMLAKINSLDKKRKSHSRIFCSIVGLEKFRKRSNDRCDLKMDEIYFSKKLFEEACDTVRSVAGDGDGAIQIIPVSIDVTPTLMRNWVRT